MEPLDYAAACRYLKELQTTRGQPAKQHLLLGNGFSINFDPARFTYGALLAKAYADKLVGPIAQGLFTRLGTQDFEAVIRRLGDAAASLEVIDAAKYASEIAVLRTEAADLKEALAQVLAGLHPERPYDIPEASYQRVRAFTDQFDSIYTANYDLLLYWALMQDIPGMLKRRSDDGFRDPGYEADYVLWDYLNPYSQTVHYLHGALHLYRGDDGLKKLTWRRTEEPLIDQIRAQLAANFYPLYVAEGSSQEKLQQIHTSDYLSKAHRSLACVGGGLLVYGLSFSDNDSHIVDAIGRSRIERMAVGLHGVPTGPANQATIAAVGELQVRRGPKKPLDVRFFDSATVPLW